MADRKLTREEFEEACRMVMNVPIDKAYPNSRELATHCGYSLEYDIDVGHVLVPLEEQDDDRRTASFRDIKDVIPHLVANHPDITKQYPDLTAP